MAQPTMSEINQLVEEILDNDDYDLDLYEMDVNHVVDTAVNEQMPFWWNEDNESNLRIALRVEYDEWRNELLVEDYEC